MPPDREFTITSDGSGRVWMTCQSCIRSGDIFTSTIKDLAQANRIAEEHFAAPGPHSGGSGDA